jgi:hypothetical protein
LKLLVGGVIFKASDEGFQKPFGDGV